MSCLPKDCSFRQGRCVGEGRAQQFIFQSKLDSEMQHSPSAQPCESPFPSAPCQPTRINPKSWAALWAGTPQPEQGAPGAAPSPALSGIPTPGNPSLSQCSGKTSPHQGLSEGSAYLGFPSISATDPHQSLFVPDSPLHVWNNPISCACHVYFQWFSGAVFCFVYWFAQCTAVLLEHWRHYCTISGRSNT